jgi:hypothetical protein
MSDDAVGLMTAMIHVIRFIQVEITGVTWLIYILVSLIISCKFQATAG